MSCILNACMGEVYSRGLCKRHYDNSYSRVRRGATSWAILESMDLASPLRNLPAYIIPGDPEVVHEVLFVGSEEHARLTLAYALRYGACNAGYDDRGDGSWMVKVNMLPKEIMRMYGYIDGLMQFEHQD